MNEEKRIVIGLTGSFGAGCSEAVSFLETQEFRKYSLSRDILREAWFEKSKVQLTDLEETIETRRKWQDAGDALRKEEGLSTLVDRALKKIARDDSQKKGANHSPLVIDSIRNPGEVEALRQTFSDFYLVAVSASQEQRMKRYDRIYKGQQKAFLVDDARDSGADELPWGQHVQMCVDISDVLVSNEQEWLYPYVKDEFYQKIYQIVELMRKPGSRRPTNDEYFMSLAYGASLRSSCWKRKVGAVIVREYASAPGGHGSYVLASGYNEVPPGIMSCAQRAGSGNPKFCVKDEEANNMLKESWKYCPKCTEALKGAAERFALFRCDKCKTPLVDFIPSKLHDLCIALHAEESAILQASRLGSVSLEGSVLYTTTFPCLLCAKMIILLGISRIVFAEPYPDLRAIRLLEEAKVPTKQFEGVKARAYHALYEIQFLKEGKQ